MSRSRTGSLTGGSGVNTITVSVVGYSDFHPNIDGCGKSTLCNRFVRPEEDNFYKSHLKVLSDSDFKSHVVNSDHWLYWGETTKRLNDSSVCIRVIEQTEFVDDSAFKTFGQAESYSKRCAATKLKSSEKIAYFCKDQLGLEDDYEKKWFPNDSVPVDGFICVYDVSKTPRSIEGSQFNQSTLVFREILPQLQRTKKPFILALTKFDQKNDDVYQDVLKTLQRKENKNKSFNHIVEVSAFLNVNVDEAFLNIARLVTQRKPKLTKSPYVDALKSRLEHNHHIKEAYLNYVSKQLDVLLPKIEWSLFYESRRQNEVILRFISCYGLKEAKTVFSSMLTEKQNDFKEKNRQKYLNQLPTILSKFLDNLKDITNMSTDQIISEYIPQRPSFNDYFRQSSREDDLDLLLQNDDGPIPLTFLYIKEARAIIDDCVHELKIKEDKVKHRGVFEESLKKSVVQPGQSLQEVCLSIVDESSYHSLSPSSRRKIYDDYQCKLRSTALYEFNELLLERTDVFYGQPGTNQMDDIRRKIEDESRYKELILLYNERQAAILRFMEFLHQPSPKSCLASPYCMDSLLPQTLSQLCLENSEYCVCGGSKSLSMKSRRSSLDDVSIQTFGGNSTSISSINSPWVRRSARQAHNHPCRQHLNLRLYIVDMDRNFEELIRDHCPCHEIHLDNTTYHVKSVMVNSPDYLNQCLAHHNNLPFDKSTTGGSQDNLVGCVFAFSTSQGLTFVENNLVRCFAKDPCDYGSGESFGGIASESRGRLQQSALGSVWSPFTLVIYLPTSQSDLKSQPYDISRIDKMTEDLHCRFIKCDSYPSTNDRLLLSRIVRFLLEASQVSPCMNYPSFRPAIQPRNLPILRITVSFVCGDQTDLAFVIAPLVKLLSLCPTLNSPEILEGCWPPNESPRGIIQLTFCSYHQTLCVNAKTKLSTTNSLPSYMSAYECNRSRANYYNTCRGHIIFASKNRNASTAIVKLLACQLPEQVCKLIISSGDKHVEFEDDGRTVFLDLNLSTERDRINALRSFLESSWSTNSELPLPPAPPINDSPRSGTLLKHSFHEQHIRSYNSPTMHPMNKHTSNTSLAKSSLAPSMQSTNSNSRTSSIADEDRTYAVPILEPSHSCNWSSANKSSLDQNKNPYTSPFNHDRAPALETKAQRSSSDASETPAKTHYRTYSDSMPPEIATGADVCNVESDYSVPVEMSSMRSYSSHVIKDQSIGPVMVRRVVPPNTSFYLGDSQHQALHDEDIYSEVCANPFSGFGRRGLNVHLTGLNDYSTNSSQADNSSKSCFSSPSTEYQHHRPQGLRTHDGVPLSDQDFPDHGGYSSPHSLATRRSSHNSGESHSRTNAAANIFLTYRERRRSYSGPVSAQPERVDPCEQRVVNLSPISHYAQIDEIDISNFPDQNIVKGAQSFAGSDVNTSTPVSGNSQSQNKKASFFSRSGARRSFKDSFKRSTHKHHNQTSPSGASKEEERRNKELKKQKKADKKRINRNESSVESRSHDQPPIDYLIKDPYTGEIPALTPFVRDCTSLIETKGMDFEGVYRTQGNQFDVNHIQNVTGKDHQTNSHVLSLQDVEVLTTLLKSLFVNYSLIPNELNDSLRDIEINSKSINEKIKRIREELLRQIRRSRLILLSHILHHLHKLCQNHEVNKMSYHNMAICWMPTFFNVTVNSMTEFESNFNSLKHILELMIENAAIIFSTVPPSNNINL